MSVGLAIPKSGLRSEVGTFVALEQLDGSAVGSSLQAHIMEREIYNELVARYGEI